MENYPLIIVFYLDADMMKVKDIIQPFAESINKMLAEKNANALAFFLPTEGEERVECINPIIMKETDMVKVNQMIEDIKQNFSVGVDFDSDVPDIEITPDKKDCTCNGGECDCITNE